MPNIHIQQIYYSNETRDAVDNGFIGLDNMSNERPDWREYWPIRRQLLNVPIIGRGYSTGSSRQDSRRRPGSIPSMVFDFIVNNTGEVDVFLFSPFFDQGAFSINIFEQGCEQHDDIMQTFRGLREMIVPDVDLETLVMDSRTTVFCNYFVARPKFWIEWLERCEVIFSDCRGRQRRPREEIEFGNRPSTGGRARQSVRHRADRIA